MFRRGPSPSRATPRHLAGSADRAPAASQRHLDAPAHRALPLDVDIDGEPEALEVAPLARVQRSRLALAVAVTLASLPLLVLDNLPSRAQANEAQVEVSSRPAQSSSSWRSRITAATAAPSTTTTAAPTTAAPETTTTDAPTTTEAPEVETVAVAAAPPPTSPPTTAPPTTAPPSGGGADPNDPATWDRLAQCESGSRWNLNTGNGYYGGLQFSLATWRNVGGAGYPHQATKAEQIKRGKILQSRAGWGQWPSCSKKLGYT